MIISIVHLFTISYGVSTTHLMMAAKQVKKIVNNSLSCPLCNKLFILVRRWSSLSSLGTIMVIVVLEKVRRSSWHPVRS